ncbi:hypothetical protein [Listeria booriae]|uniref:Uncharacterized protein n=1 Tax=Listeria booriae TaxID=1552123 RepID=A0A7X0WMZ9_9LIST|nr:hypothetical protein [Listeria booriae]MBC1212280.1 hypothetical protein [Listeria booriae]MBC1229700.1 hypothetical protein [Listeria booriae]MBC1232166.1 hypothetical protein [Listeria booriae]MBC1248000.1 hypothetical protein [Listeria booriae]MBC1293396.1 hypothetical protein [Listeria booriae]
MWKAFFSGVGIAALVIIFSLVTTGYSMSSLFSFVLMVLIFASIICSALVSIGRSQNPNRKVQLRWSILLAVAAIPSFVGFVISYYFT